ncbi:MAG: hypothetical protein GX316_08025 [Firmicutes bacterium]|nr:hypothetical protein [Bacillota bacterium]
MKYIIGVDGGGTRTRALLADAAGTVLGMGFDKASNCQTVGLENACRAITNAVAEAVNQAKTRCFVTDADLNRGLVAVLGLAGADRPSDKNQLAKSLTVLFPFTVTKLVIKNDAQIALAGAVANKPGVVLIAGTGSIAFGKDGSGHEARSGGWGPILGDEGSGYAIGTAALRAVLMYYDGRGRRTSLTRELLSKFNIKHPEAFVPLVYQGPLQRSEIAALAGLVLEEADSGDKVSQTIVRTAAAQLVELVSAVIRRLEWDEHSIPVAGSGGLLQPGNFLWKQISQLLGGLHPSTNFVNPLLSPVQGGVLLGWEYLDNSLEGQSLASFISNLTTGPI